MRKLFKIGKTTVFITGSLLLKVIEALLFAIVMFAIGFFSSYVYNNLFPEQSRDIQHSVDELLSPPPDAPLK